MIKKQFVKSRKVTKVTFELADVQADAVHLIADFNGWSPISFSRAKDGSWKLVQELEPGQNYQFRYLLEQGSNRQFINDPEADFTIANDKGSENAVIQA
jgi:1,4-alpha-glucan branching enzyme